MCGPGMGQVPSDPLSPESLPGQNSSVDTGAQLNQEPGNSWPFPHECDRGFHRAQWPWPWFFKCYWQLDYHIPQTFHSSRAPKPAFEKCLERGAVGRGFTGHHSESRDAFLPALLVRLDLVVRDTETNCQDSQQLYNMKPHPESEAFVFTYQKAPS